MKERLSSRVSGRQRTRVNESHAEENPQEFVERALRSRYRARETGTYVSATAVVGALKAKLRNAAKKTRLTSGSA